MNNFIVRRKFEPNVSESEPSVEPEVVELATEPELEIASIDPSTLVTVIKKKKKRKAVKESVKDASARSRKRSFEFFFSKSSFSSGSTVSRPSASAVKKRKSNGGLTSTAIHKPLVAGATRGTGSRRASLLWRGFSSQTLTPFSLQYVSSLLQPLYVDVHCFIAQ
ncbi:hypothetical protein LSH36_998g00024 [Paralvinella palmiformis]|uniref:Uncharacterized protein n=1 Tax=Paralvinella palmiformis TaxID=53620 RepID=A0AAD9IW49_9ANNE|nr:hypothetical protein LSH36_998g00024 [Paralvinella palmiformis]